MTSANPSRPVRVLVCENHAQTAFRLQTVLSRLGYEVVGCATNGEEALDLTVALQPDVILMDVLMPRLCGL